MAAIAGGREPAEVLAIAARRTDGCATADGPAATRSEHRAWRSACIESLADTVPTHQVLVSRSPCHFVHDAARCISMPPLPVHTARRHRCRIADSQPQSDP